MQEWLIEWFSTYPYAGVALMFLACGLGLPVPEEIVLLFAGYTCYSGYANRETMMAVAVGAILLGDIVPFALGRLFGPNLLRLRIMRFFISPQRLARFDRWFRRRGDTVVFFSRFIAGMRVVSYFVAGTMKMSWSRFLLLDLAGVLLVAPLLVWLGDHYGGAIEALIEKVKTVERGILIAGIAVAVVAGVWYWLRLRRRQRRLVGAATESFVEPSEPLGGPILPSETGATERSAEASADEAGTEHPERPGGIDGGDAPEEPIEGGGETPGPTDPEVADEAAPQPRNRDSNS